MHKSGLLSFSGKFRSQDCRAHVPPAWRQSTSTQERPLSLEMLSTLPISITPSPLTMERLPLYSLTPPAGALQAAESAAPAVIWAVTEMKFSISPTKESFNTRLFNRQHLGLARQTALLCLWRDTIPTEGL